MPFYIQARSEFNVFVSFSFLSDVLFLSRLALSRTFIYRDEPITATTHHKSRGIAGAIHLLLGKMPEPRSGSTIILFNVAAYLGCLKRWVGKLGNIEKGRCQAEKCLSCITCGSFYFIYNTYITRTQ